MKIVTLCENTLMPSVGLKASHGVSFYIEYNNHTLLYDVGQDNLFIKNAELLNVDLSKCEKVIISHGHFDHAGGLKFLDQSFLIKDKVLIQANSFNEHLRVIDNQMMDIGISNKLNELKPLGQSINDSFELFKGVWCISHVSLPADYKSSEKGLIIRDSNGNCSDDTFDDELNLAFETSKGLIILSGCSHRGVLNIIEHAKKVTGMDKVYAFVGGMHLAFTSKEESLSIIKELKKLNVNKYIIGHCTGLDSMCFMKNLLSENTEIINNYVGFKLIV